MPRPKSFQLERAFNAAYKSVKANQDALNAMDGVNGNHGSNTAANFKVISQAIKNAKGQAPSAQLNQAADQLAAKGQGGTAQHYVNGLRDASRQFEGRDRLGQNDVPALLQSLMGSVPAQGHPAAQSKPQAATSSGHQNEIGDLLGALGGQGAVQPTGGAHTGASASSGGGASVLSALLGMAAGGGGSAQAAPSGPAAADPLSALLGGGSNSGAAQDPFAALLGGATGGQGASAAQDPLAALLGGATGGGQSSGGAAQDPFAALLGGAAGGQSASAPQSDPLGGLLNSLIPDKPGLDLADVIQAGTAYMGAQAQGADTASAALQAVMAALRGVNPMNAGSARTASGGLLTQSILDSAFGKK